MPLPMAHVNNEGTHTTIVIMSAYTGSHILSMASVGFSTILHALKDGRTLTEGEVYDAMYPQAATLHEIATVFGPDVITYDAARSRYSIAMLNETRTLNTTMMQTVIATIAHVNDKVFARRIIFATCQMNNAALITLLHADDEMPYSQGLIDAATTLHEIVPDIDAQLEAAAHTPTPLRHSVVAEHTQHTWSTQNRFEAELIPAYVGVHGGIAVQRTPHPPITHDIIEHMRSRVIESAPAPVVDFEADAAFKDTIPLNYGRAAELTGVRGD